MSDSSLESALRWAIDTSLDAAMASADWLATDIDETRPSAIRLLTDPATPLAQLEQAKSVYKTMRIVGETAADRRLGARLYAASIAAAIVHHDQRISGQSSAALARAFRGLVDDPSTPEELRSLATEARRRVGDDT